MIGELKPLSKFNPSMIKVAIKSLSGCRASPSKCAVCYIQFQSCAYFVEVLINNVPPPLSRITATSSNHPTASESTSSFLFSSWGQAPKPHQPRCARIFSWGILLAALEEEARQRLSRTGDSFHKIVMSTMDIALFQSNSEMDWSIFRCTFAFIPTRMAVCSLLIDSE